MPRVLDQIIQLFTRQKSHILEDVKTNAGAMADYQKALDQASIVAITDVKGVIIHANDNFCSISGYSRDELLGKTHRIVNSDHHSGNFFRDMWQTISAGEIWKGEIRNKKKNGEYYWTDSTIVPFLDSGGRPYQYMAIRNDITAGKLAEGTARSLREEAILREQRFATVLDRINEGFIMVDENFHYTYVNKKIGQMTGVDPARLIGRNMWQEFPKAVGSATWASITEAMKTNSFQHSIDHVESNDTWQENFVYPSEKGLFIFIRDITASKKAEEKVRLNEKFYRTIASNIPGSLICILNTQLQYLLVEGDLQQSLDYSRDTLINKKMPEVLRQERVDFLLPHFQRALKGETIVTETTINGIDLQYRFVPLRDEADTVYAIMLAGFDITALKVSQKRVEDINQQLEKQVSQRTAELQELNKELESFCYSVAHDLRSPLRALNGYAGMIQEDYGDKIGGQGNLWISKLMKSATRMNNLIDDLLNLSRLDRQKPVLETIDMRKLTETAISETDVSGCTLHLGSLANAKGDRSLVLQVMLNLLSNAVKYSQNRPQPVILINSEESGNFVTYSVSDNGAGFEMKFYDKLFAVFQRLHSQQEFPGTGIGLALCHRIIKKLGGRIWAKAEVDKGATFYFTLPKS